MERDEALRLLKGGPDGITEWNRRRKDGEAIPDLTKATLANVNLTNVNLTGTILTDATLANATLTSAALAQADLRGADFTGTTLLNAQMNEANLIGMRIDGQTNIAGARFDGAKIDRYTLDCFTLEQIPIAARVRMEILDDVAKLRSAYSGFWRILNAIFITAFVAPYVVVVARLALLAGFTADGKSPPPDTVSLLGALGRFIWSGGRTIGPDWGPPTWVFGAFCVAFLYNALRACLLYKTLKLETEQTVRGLPVNFRLDASRWGWVYQASRILLVINLLAVGYHTVHFLGQRVTYDAVTFLSPVQAEHTAD